MSTATLDAPQMARTNSDPAIARLPTQVQKKLAHLRKTETRWRALADGLATEYERARENLAAAQSALAHFDRRYQLPENDPSRLTLLTHIDEAREELRRIGAERAGATDPGFRFDDLISWVRRQGPHAKFKAVAPNLRLGKRERPAEAFEANRQAQVAARERIASAENAPRSRGDLRKLLRDEITAMASRGAPQVREDGTIEWPVTSLVAVSEGAAVGASIPDALGLLAWLARDELAKRLDAELSRIPESPAALSEADQRAAIVQAQADLLKLQRDAEHLAELMEGDGITVTRNGVPIPVLLGVEVIQ